MAHTGLFFFIYVLLYNNFGRKIKVSNEIWTRIVGAVGEYALNT